mmetsp:Transcript_25992/g.84139  ORF Transcript_25992/g.84139 Transcript_25992/m.84139 type:complete len:242 (-) Transcript_25992:55-780(-)
MISRMAGASPLLSSFAAAGRRRGSTKTLSLFLNSSRLLRMFFGRSCLPLLWWVVLFGTHLRVTTPLALGRSSPKRRRSRSMEIVKRLKESRSRDEVAELLRAHDSVLDMWIVTTAMGRLRRFGEAQEALRLFDRSKARGIALNVFGYNAAISACGRNWRRALDLLDELKERGFDPDIITYNALISACASAGEWQKALALWDELSGGEGEDDSSSSSESSSSSFPCSSSPQSCGRRASMTGR